MKQPKQWRPYIVLAALVVYAAALSVLAVDQVFVLDIFPPEKVKWVFKLLKIHEPKDIENPQRARKVIHQCWKTFERTRYEQQASAFEKQLFNYAMTGEDVAKGQKLLEESRALATQRLAEIEPFVSVRVFIKKLMDGHCEIRSKSYELLLAVTGRWYGEATPKDGFGYNAQADPAQRALAVRQWKNWWKQHKDM